MEREDIYEAHPGVVSVVALMVVMLMISVSPAPVRRRT
jgi:hypothetical protein